MAAAWPAGLPQRALRRSYLRTAPDDVIRSAMDAGPAFQRKKSGSTGDQRRVSFKFTLAEVLVFRNFWENTLLSGTGEFIWSDPQTASSVTARFVGGNPPTEKPYPTSSFWQIDAIIEVL